MELLDGFKRAVNKLRHRRGPWRHTGVISSGRTVAGNNTAQGYGHCKWRNYPCVGTPNDVGILYTYRSICVSETRSWDSSTWRPRMIDMVLIQWRRTQYSGTYTYAYSVLCAYFGITRYKPHVNIDPTKHPWLLNRINDVLLAWYSSTRESFPFWYFPMIKCWPSRPVRITYQHVLISPLDCTYCFDLKIDCGISILSSLCMCQVSLDSDYNTWGIMWLTCMYETIDNIFHIHLSNNIFRVNHVFTPHWCRLKYKGSVLKLSSNIIDDIDSRCVCEISGEIFCIN